MAEVQLTDSDLDDLNGIAGPPQTGLDKRITNSKDLRKLRAILPDPVARANFLAEVGDLDTAMLRLAPQEKKPKGGLSDDLEAAVEAMKSVPWTTLQDLKGDPELLKKIEAAEELLRSLKKAIT